MNSTLEVISIRSVPSTFSWDSGQFYVDSNNIFPSQTIDGKPVYVGYAPITQGVFTSSPTFFDIRSAYLVRAVNFGDYYNSSTNVLNTSGIADIRFTHSYVMPGLYSISISNAEYSNVNSLTWSEITTIDPALLWTEYTGISATIYNGQTVVPNVTALVTNSTASFLISVVEILPTAYLSSTIPTTSPENINFPLTVTITPRYTLTGSFPIEKIVWDLGDGSPLITKTRWDNNTAFPFVTSGAMSADPLDPRNFDIVHTYVKPDNSVYSFYPSITAYAYSTGSSDACSITIGPIIAQNQKGIGFKILQNELNEDGTALIGQVGDDVGIWKTL